MARDSAVGRERVLIVPGNLTLENAANQLAGAAQSDINQQILEVSTISTFYFAKHKCVYRLRES